MSGAHLIGKMVHFVSYGTRNGVDSSICRAAFISDLFYPDNNIVDLFVINSRSFFFNEHVSRKDLEFDPKSTLTSGTWHWPSQHKEEMVNEESVAEKQAWEYHLEGVPIPTGLEEKEEVKTEAKRLEKEASQAGEWELLQVPVGINALVDLTRVFEPIRVSKSNYEYRGMKLVDRLVDHVIDGRGQQVARRLQQGLNAMFDSPDDTVRIEVTTDQPAGYIKFVAWCREGDRNFWRVAADLYVVIQNGRMRVTNISSVTFTTQDWGGGAITYVDASGTLGHVAFGWLTGFTGRLSIKNYAKLIEIEDKPDYSIPEAPTVEEFAGRL